MPALVDDVAAVTRSLDFGRVRAAVPGCMLFFLLLLVALQRGGYYPESWGLPAIACGWIVALVALLGERQRLRVLELVQLGGLVGLGGWALASSAWTAGGLGTSLPQAQLVMLYAGALAAVFLAFRRSTPLVAALWAAIVAVSLVGLGTRLFPTIGFDPSGGNRLAAPLGYWNGLGLWAAMGLALGSGLAGRARSYGLRALAAAGCVPCAATLYFTFSRGAWIALALGFSAAFAIDPRRLGSAARLLLLAPWPAAGVVLASRYRGLTDAAPTLEQAREDGRSFALVLAALTVGAAVTAVTAGLVEARWSVPGVLRRIFAVGLLSACALGLCAVAVRFGTPWAIATRVAHQFARPSAGTTGDLNSRLFDVSSNGRVDLWKVAWADAQRHPVVGSGAGSYAAEWYQNRPTAFDATNAHELYLETLAELGPVGLACLLAALGAPLVAAWRARRHPLASGVTAAYVAFLVHLGFDWDWQLAAVSLAGLTCGAGALIMARQSRSARAGIKARTSIALGGVMLACFALWSQYGAQPLGQARDAVGDGQWRLARARATTATARVGSFSAVSWQLLGEADTALREPARARAALRIAVDRDPSSWEAWYDLAMVANGSQRLHATRRALELNPRGSETMALARADGASLTAAPGKVAGS